MNTIQQQATRARRRLFLQSLGTWVSWSLFAALLVAVAAVICGKVWNVGVDPDRWFWSWTIGSVISGLVISVIGAWLTGPSLEYAAQEVDKRFGLRERISSSLSLTAMEQESPAGRALLEDAAKRAERIEIPEQFALKAHPRGLLPLFPAALVVAAMLLPNPEVTKAKVAVSQSTEVTQVKNAAEQLKKQLEQRRRAAEAKGLEETNDLFKEIEKGLDKMQSQEGTDRKEALVKLNELKKQLEEKKAELGSAEQMKRNLANMKEIEQGPADKLAKQLEKGNFGEAAKEMDALAKQLKDGSLTPEQQKQLQKQVEKLQQQLQEMKARHEQAKEDLKRQIEQAKQENNLQQAGELQKKLDQLMQQEGAMQNMQQMAEQLQKAAEKMQQGDQQGAAQDLEQLADQLDQMQGEMEQLEDLENAMNQFDKAKESMRCKDCNGKGCKECNGQGQGKSDEFGQQDFAKGQGQGRVSEI